MSKNQKSELLLPVGNMNMCLAAIHNGADAIYVGVPFFNARGRSADLTLEELKEIIDTCHLYGVKVNLAFNVVIFENELPKVKNLLYQLLELSPDAIIVQDVGLAALIRKIAPTQTIHASTQMTVTNFEAIELLEDLKIKRFVLGREVSLPEIAAIKNKTDKELEVFVHGALCVAYSGQCFTSESIGGRSANRGQCAQSCRFEYEMFVDGQKRSLGDKKYLVSPKDLCGIAEIPELLDHGVASFKVEGRLKTPEYVAAAAKNYRLGIDAHLSNCTLGTQEIIEAKKQLSATYSRGFFSGWLHGVDHQQLVDGTFGAHRGLFIGEVTKINLDSIHITSQDSLSKGDGLLFVSQMKDRFLESGSFIYDVKVIKKGFEVYLSRDFNYKGVKVGDKVYLNHNKSLMNDLTKSFTDKNLKKRIPISLKVFAQIAKPLRVLIQTSDISLVFNSDCDIEPASSSPTNLSLLKEELGALGATCFYLKDIALDSETDFYIPQKSLKILRRQFVEELMQQRVFRTKSEITHIDLKELRQKHSHFVSDKKAVLNVLLREFSQVKEFVTYTHLLKEVLGVVILDYEFGKDYAPSVELLKKVGLKVGIATTRILKPGEYYNFKIIEKASPDVILVRNLGALYYFKDKNFELIGDFSLNVTNSISAQYFLDKKLSSICASYDLDFRQLCDLVKNSNSHQIEVTIHQYMPSFHMEHCVFAAFLSKGSSFRDCGKPCEHHQIELKDQFGHFHQIKADQECRNTMFNASSQSAATLIPKLLELGVGHFRFEALYEKGDVLKNKLLIYSQLVSGLELDKQLEMLNQLGSFEKYGLSNKLAQTKEHKNRKKIST